MKFRALSAMTFAAMLAATTAVAQKDPSQNKEWGEMFDRIDKIVNPYQARLGLDRYWMTYCLAKVNGEEIVHPKDGSVPLGIQDWRTLDHDAFHADLGIYEEYRTGAMMLCLANVKATLNGAEYEWLDADSTAIADAKDCWPPIALAQPSKRRSLTRLGSSRQRRMSGR